MKLSNQKQTRHMISSYNFLHGLLIALLLMPRLLFAQNPNYAGGATFSTHDGQSILTNTAAALDGNLISPMTWSNPPTSSPTILRMQIT